MSVYFSKTTMGFHHTTDGVSSIPADAVIIADEYFRALIAGQSNGDCIACDENGTPYLTKPTQAPLTYVEQRIAAYPSIPDQLDQIFHEGLDAWKATIQSVKDTYPKGGS